jgi:SulP family sulfate permease
MVAIFGLIDFKEALHLWKTDRTDFYMLMVTFLGTLAFGIEMGIAVGVILSLSMVIYRSAYPHIASLGLVPGTHYYRNVDRFQQVIQRPEVLVMRFDAPLFFANTSYFREHLEKLVRKKGDRLKLIVLNMEAISTVDSSAVHMLKALIEEYRNHGIAIYLAAVIGPVRDVLYKSSLIDLIGVDNLFLQVYDAVAHFDHADEQSDVPLRSVAIQTNIKNQRKGNLWD